MSYIPQSKLAYLPQELTHSSNHQSSTNLIVIHAIASMLVICHHQQWK